MVVMNWTLPDLGLPIWTALRTLLMVTASDRLEEGVEAVDQGADNRSVPAAIPQTPPREALDNFSVPTENSGNNVVVSHSCFQHP